MLVLQAGSREHRSRHLYARRSRSRPARHQLVLRARDLEGASATAGAVLAAGRHCAAGHRLALAGRPAAASLPAIRDSSAGARGPGTQFLAGAGRPARFARLAGFRCGALCGHQLLHRGALWHQHRLSLRAAGLDAKESHRLRGRQHLTRLRSHAGHHRWDCGHRGKYHSTCPGCPVPAGERPRQCVAGKSGRVAPAECSTRDARTHSRGAGLIGHGQHCRRE